ncbi:MAG: hypothetical protein ACFE0Q_03420 [Anaerolineae bacterium]
MWRIDGVRYYQYVTLILVVLEVTIVMVVVAWLVANAFNDGLLGGFQNLLDIANLVTLVMLVNLVVYIILFHAVSRRNERRYQQAYHDWMKRWAQSYLSNTPPEHIPLEEAVAESHFDYTKSMSRDPRLVRWAQQSGLMRYWYEQLYQRNKLDVLHALEAFGVLGTAEDIPSVLHHTHSDNLDVQMISAKALAQMIFNQPREGRTNNLHTMRDALLRVRLPVFAFEEIFAILDEYSPTVKQVLFQQAELPDNLLLACINSVKSHYEVQFLNDVAHYLPHKNPLVQQAVLGVFATLQQIPSSVYRDVLQMVVSNDKGVRERALSAIQSSPLYRTRLPLWLALGDADWDVRFAAAQILQAYGEAGMQVLQTARERHDRSAGREVAKQLLDAET